MKRSRGLTLLELMVSLGMSTFIVLAAAGAFATAIAFDKQNSAVLSKNESRIDLEHRIRQLLRGAYVSADQNDGMTYFLGEISGSSPDASYADTLTFTTLSEPANGSALSSTDDFETLNQSYGPQGGVSEVSLSMSPVGEQGQTKSGLFLREQRPADGDPTQGGYEMVLNSDVKSIQFEFYNGNDWDPSWGTSGVQTTSSTTAQNTVQTDQDGRRIPAAVRVTYSLNSEQEGTTHQFIVRLPFSDVTAENPITVTGGATTP